MLVTFSGLDGAGKSTQISRLKKKLELNGSKTVYLWARGGYTPGFEFTKRCVRALALKKLPPPGLSRARQEVMAIKWVSKIWLTVAICDLIIFWAIYARLQSCFGKVVLCDRYLNDTRLDFMRSFTSIDFENFLFWKMLVFVAPKANHSFVLWTPVSVSLKRSQEKKEPFPDDEATLSWRLAYYLDEKFFPSKDYTKIDCTASVDKIAEIIWSSIKLSTQQ